MKIARPKTESWHNYEEGDASKPISKYYKKGFWKRYDRKKYFRRTLNQIKSYEDETIPRTFK